MNNQIFSGIVAIALGGLACFLLFVPFVALSYRRRGELKPGRVLLWIAAAVYGWAIWTYTLLPLPQSDDFRCVGANLNPLTAVTDVQAAFATGNPLTSPHLLQLVFNVLLFMPLGFFVRVLAGRGFIVAVLLGFAVSVFIEFTQLTGVWGLYHCAYRVFDVVDMMTNTLGAALGAIAAYVVPARLRDAKPSPEANLPRPVRRGRRILAVLCDAIGFGLVSFGVTAVIALGVGLVTKDPNIADWVGNLGFGIATALWVIVILVSGQSIGDKAVQLRYAGGTAPVLWQRIARILGGVVAFNVLSVLPDPLSGWSFVFGVIAFILLFTTKDGRGLPGLLSGQRLVDSRATQDPQSTDTRAPVR